MRAFLTLACSLALLPLAQATRILLIPVDDRPAVSQYASMIGEIANCTVTTPPAELLGRFKTPGNPDLLLAWLAKQDLASYSAVIVNTDMVAYGGLIASRTDRSSYNLASARLRALWKVRKSAHHVPFYAFSTLTRIAPTAVVENRAWRNDLYYWAINSERARLYGDPEAKRKAEVHASRVPAEELARYRQVRERNVAIQIDLVKMAYHGAFNQVVFGQDDAAEVGPHIREIASLRKEIDRLRVAPRTQFCMGIDQVSNCLVSRALCDVAKWAPTIALVTADSDGLDQVAPYESRPVRESLADQIATSGARVVANSAQSDYTLFLNTPSPDLPEFQRFVSQLDAKLQERAPVALADINLGWSGTADRNLFEAITAKRTATNLISYAGWNTAGNTMGTTIPAANAYLVALKLDVDPYHREIAARTFVLHRLVNDYFYNRYVRPEAYKLIEGLQNGSREEITTLAGVDKVEAYVRADMTKRLQELFLEQMVAQPFQIQGVHYHPVGLKNIQVRLPWPRAYEVELTFELDVRRAG